MATKKNVTVHSTLTRGQIDAMGDILDQLAGTALERTGDIAITLGGARYVINRQSGSFEAASVDRDGGVEIVGAAAPYRRAKVREVAELGLERAHSLSPGEEFTLKQLAAEAWDNLSAVEQRNAGKRFRDLLEPKPLGELDEWKTSDNEWHYRRK